MRVESMGSEISFETNLRLPRRVLRSWEYWKTGFREGAEQLLLCSLVALSLVFAASHSAKADDEANPKKSEAKADDGAVMEKPGAEVMLRIPLPEQIMAPSTVEEIRMRYDIFKNTQEQLIRSRVVLQEALRIPGIGELGVVKGRKDIIDWLGKNLRVNSIPKTEIMVVSLSDASPKENALLVNAVADAYMSEVVDAERQKKDHRISELKGIYIDKSQEVKDGLNELRRMAESLGTSESETLNVRQKIELEELSHLRTELLRAQFDVNRMKGELLSEQAELATIENFPILDIECQPFVNADYIAKNLQQEFIQAKKGSDSKDKVELERLNKEYNQRVDEIRKEISSKNRQDIEKKIKRLESGISQAVKQLEITMEEVKRLRKEADRFGMSSIDMQMRRDDIKNRQKSLESIVAELEKLKMETKSAPGIYILQKAEVPE
jgi:hypothetical protein